MRENVVIETRFQPVLTISELVLICYTMNGQQPLYKRERIKQEKGIIQNTFEAGRAFLHKLLSLH